jgi:hypothetical protein
MNTVEAKLNVKGRVIDLKLEIEHNLKCATRFCVIRPKAR